jgi:hypothetical protein
VNFNFDVSRVRGGMVSADYALARGSATPAPKKSFGLKPGDPASDIAWRRALDDTHNRLRSANGPQLSDLLDLYVILVARWASAHAEAAPNIVGGLVPGGSILSAAVSAVGSIRGSSAGMYGAV